tara:strand:+ start:60 stop:743 length:684 start_codon:yes stop_codon:yes gene_type:complete
MTLPSSGSLDYNSIRAEFGSPSSNVYLSLYYRGGPYTYAVPANSNITTSSSGQIAVSNFYGADSKTDYAAAPFGYYTSGGKVPQTNAGASNANSNIPSFSDTSMKVGSVSTNTINVNMAESLFVSAFSFGDFASNVPLLNRTIYYYNTSGALTHQWYTWPPNSQIAGSWGNSGASYPDTLLMGSVFGPEPGQPANAHQFTGGPESGQSLYNANKWNMSNALIVIKAF